MDVGDSRKRWFIIGGLAAAVLVAAIALILANRGGAKAGAVDSPAAPATAAAPTEQTTPGTAPTLTGAPAPRPAAAAPAEPAPSVDTTSSSGAAVHDHRDTPGDFDRTPTQVPPEKAVFVGREFAGNVGSAVAPIARECATKIPADARGAKPVIQVQVIVTIKDGRMSIDDVATDFRDVTGDQQAVKDCVKSKAGAISVDATGQPDVDHYSITMPMRVAS